MKNLQKVAHTPTPWRIDALALNHYGITGDPASNLLDDAIAQAEKYS